MEVGAFIWLLAAMLAPFAVPFFLIVASLNRWVFLATTLSVATGAALLIEYWSRTVDAPGGVAIMFVAPLAMTGWLAGGGVWIASALRRMNRHWLQSAIYYALALLLAASFTYPWVATG